MVLRRDVPNAIGVGYRRRRRAPRRTMPDPTAASVPEGGAPSSVFASLLPRAVLASAPARAFFRVPPARRDLFVVVAVAAALFLPWLGAPGLWDPWETHYAEVGRSMLQRNDWLYPYWENAFFFSKPVLSLWLSALGLWVTGANGDGQGPVGPLAEWGVRTPFALLAILGVSLLHVAASRLFGRRVGLLAGVALATSPLYFLLARQAMTDMPFVALVTCALSCFAIAELAEDERSRASRDLWLFAFYAFVALATLAKGLLGFALPGAVILATMLVTGDLRLPLRAKIPQGLVIVALIALPWYLALSLFPGKDDESKTFLYRFFVHDHWNRLTEGVHTTTPGGTFAYFVEQLGFGLFPWVALLPGALAVIARVRPRTGGPRDRAIVFFVVWAAIAYTVFTLASTKFHHYAFPAVPALVLLAVLFLDRLIEEGLDAHLVPLLLGFVLFAVVAHDLAGTPKHLADLFVYKYDRPYPWAELESEAPSLSWKVGDRRLWLTLAPKPTLAGLFAGLGAALFASWWWRSRAFVAASLVGGALLFAAYGGWVHWRGLSPHWSQRDLFDTYFEERVGAEPIAAYYMNWRGETFYSKNRVRQVKTLSLTRELAEAPGREFFIVEQSRLASLQGALGAGFHTQVLDRSSHKYYLVLVEGAGEAEGGTGVEPSLESPPD